MKTFRKRHRTGRITFASVTKSHYCTNSTLMPGLWRSAQVHSAVRTTNEIGRPTKQLYSSSDWQSPELPWLSVVLGTLTSDSDCWGEVIRLQPSWWSRAGTVLTEYTEARSPLLIGTYTLTDGRTKRNFVYFISFTVMKLMLVLLYIVEFSCI